MRLPPLHIATAFISKTKTSAFVPPSSSSLLRQFLLPNPSFTPQQRALFGTTNALLNMKSNAATQAEGAVIVGGGIAGLAMAVALRNVAGGECFYHYYYVHKMRSS